MFSVCLTFFPVFLYCVCAFLFCFCFFVVVVHTCACISLLVSLCEFCGFSTASVLLSKCLQLSLRFTQPASNIRRETAGWPKTLYNLT